MIKKEIIRRSLVLTLSLVIGFSMTGISVLAADDAAASKAGENQMSTTEIGELEGSEVNEITGITVNDGQKVDISWNPVEGATSYKIKIMAGDMIISEETTSNTFYSKELEGGKTYTVEVSAEVDGNQYVGTTSFTKNPQQQVELTVTGQSSKYGAADFVWNLISNAQSYEVTLYKDNVKVKTETVTDTNYQATGLVGGAKYKLQVTTTVDGQEFVGTSPVVVVVGKMNVTALKDYKGVTLKWNAPKEAVKNYIVYRNGAAVKASNVSVKKSNGMVYAYVSGASENTSHRYKVEAKDAAGKRVLVSNEVKGSTVRTAYVTVYVKISKTLTSHDGRKAKTRVKVGEKIKSSGFNKNGHKFYINRTSTKNASYDYTSKWDYTKEEATNYVNHRGLKSGSGKLVWISMYTQQLYVFSGSKGKWKCIDTWKISTGKASTPSPTGTKSIWTKIARRHNLPYWSCFSSYNALHAVTAQSWKNKLGRPASGGCVRNMPEKAKWVYKNVPMKTTVLLY
ncbi:MAG: L,D-transpeptidase [Bacillota bacterium]|nr:L,D-transpeptidase [Bacillota bacterium]